MKILFIGCVLSSKLILEKLIEMNENIVGVITKKKSEYNSDFQDIASICIENSIDYIYTENINESSTIEYIKEKKPDVIYCFGWSQIISKSILKLPPKGVIGFHPAALPNNRGRHPIIWALALGLKETKSSFFIMDEDADTGDIISQEKVYISYEDDADSLYLKIMDIALKQLYNFTKDLKEDRIKKIRQKEEGNYWRKRDKSDGEIDWRMSSYTIYNLVRALTKPYIGAHFKHYNNEYKVWKVKEIKDGYENLEPGKIVEVYSDTCFLIKCGEGLIKVEKCENIKLENGEYLR